jgi:hypothetical protein
MRFHHQIVRLHRHSGPGWLVQQATRSWPEQQQHSEEVELAKVIGTMNTMMSRMTRKPQRAMTMTAIVRISHLELSGTPVVQLSKIQAIPTAMIKMMMKKKSNFTITIR